MKHSFPVKSIPVHPEMPEPPENMQDVLIWLQNKRPYAYATIIDYKAQIARIPEIFGVNNLRYVEADAALFNPRLKQNRFPAEHFKSNEAWLRWSGKIIGMLSRFHGETDARRERRKRQDGWLHLLDLANLQVGVGTGRSPKMLIPIRVLADEARKAGIEPHALTAGWFAALGDELPRARWDSVRLSLKNLHILASLSPDIATMLPMETLPESVQARRAKQYTLSEALARQADQLIEEIGAGVYDPIMGDRVGCLAPATLAVKRAALRKYLGAGVAHDIISRDCVDLKQAFAENVFYKVVRALCQETDPSRRISARSLHQYVDAWMALGAHLGVPVSFMKDSQKRNATLKQGRELRKTMPRETREFCAGLLRNRGKEMTFRSLHLRFKEHAERLIAADEPTTSFTEEHIIQFGILGAYSAIALWGLPLRIANMRDLRHLGPHPNLVLPQQARARARLQIPKEAVKNRVDISAHLAQGPTRGLEVVEWYIEHIRPRIPWADRSEYLFPGYNGKSISDKALRNWLQHHSRDLGIQMSPHNFRHGLASLWLRSRPGDYSGAARLLCNSPATVRTYYAWIDHEAEMINVQNELARQAGFRVDDKENYDKK
ncbi:site-specific integrase [Falsirhodobacter algicola]|uniref:Tyr recombinase domain-containing protein n=1 Tax=Falsirhodobacter algicola TaxID=2692330 RepID=A0A8J8MVS4_9RHOB|nr:site-specific integrase [Falsirhodobacter algicola]QUS37404.1 hypothetical protein GR316_13550 [Falsirhodobacter algicola]